MTFISALLLLFSELFQPGEALVPEVFEKLSKVLETLGPQAVQTPGSVAPLGDQSRVFENRQVLRDGRTGDVKMRCDLARRPLPSAHEHEDLPPCRLGARLQR